MESSQGRKGSYGIDAPGVVRNLFWIGVTFLVLGVGVFYLFSPSHTVAGEVIGGILLFGGGGCLVESLYMIWSSKVGKFRERERLLDLVQLRGDERVLDVGCGRGLLLNGAARRLSTGKAVGVDIWNRADQSGNHPDCTRRNAEIEGVAGRVEVVDGDAQELPFETDSFDVVVSSLAIHNIDDRGGRERALREILRVLKPGGRLAILDFRHVRQYATLFRELGVEEVRVNGPHFSMFPPVRIVTGCKPL